MEFLHLRGVERGAEARLVDGRHHAAVAPLVFCLDPAADEVEFALEAVVQVLMVFHDSLVTTFEEVLAASPVLLAPAGSVAEENVIGLLVLSHLLIRAQEAHRIRQRCQEGRRKRLWHLRPAKLLLNGLFMNSLNLRILRLDMLRIA